MPRSFDDGSEHVRRRLESRDPDERSGGSEYPDRLGYGRRRRDRDLHQIDRMHCLAMGDEARHTYVVSDEVEPAMLRREEQFASAQSEYVAARTTVLSKLKLVEEPLKGIRERVMCLIEHQDQDRETLDLAWNRVKHRHESCLEADQFDESECDFGFDVDLEESSGRLLALRAQYDDRVTDAESEFDDLVGEPDLLTARGTALEAEVATLAEDVGADGARGDLCYARLVVTEYHRETIWGSFDSPNEYEDLLRACMRCSVRGRRALTAIIGELAVRQCRKDKRRVRCDWLRNHLATEIVAEATEIHHQEHRDRGGAER